MINFSLGLDCNFANRNLNQNCTRDDEVYCDFVVIFGVYTCSISNERRNDEIIISRAIGEHKTNLSDANVKGISIENSAGFKKIPGEEKFWKF